MRVKELLKEKGMTSKELAARLGMTETGLSIAISDKGNPPLKRLEEIAAALEVEITELFEKRGDFIAFVSTGGDTKRFDRPDELLKYIETITKNQ